eukprot:7876443-Ditylum_brightwellii.AAC.1
MFQKSVPESKPSDVAEEGAWQIQMHQLAFGLEKDIMEFFKHRNIALGATKRIIAEDESNGIQQFVIPEDMDMTNPL